MRTRKTAEFYESQKRLATEHPVFEDTGKGEPVREPSNASGEGLLLSSFTVVRIGAAQKAAERSREARTAGEERGSGAEDRRAEVSEGGDGPAGLQKQLTAALVELAQVQQELDK